MKTIQFKPLCKKDLNLLFLWFQEPIIHERYARNMDWSLEEIRQKYLPRIVGDENIPSFITYREDAPIGFIQYYFLAEHFPEGILNDKNALFINYQATELAGIYLLQRIMIAVKG